MNDLPVCRCRAKTIGSRLVECRSPLIAHAGGMLTNRNVCGRCPFADRACEPERQRNPDDVAVVLQLPTQNLRRPEAADLPCQHRGEVLEKRECKICGGGFVTYDVFACTKHGECSTAFRDRQLKCCFTCDERDSSTK